MANPLYGQNKIDNKIDDLVTGKKQVYRFATPPIVHDYEHAAHQLVDGTAADTVLHTYADGLQITFAAVVAQAIDRPAPRSTCMNYAYDQTDDDGIQWINSCITTKGREGIDRFTVGLQAFSAELRFKLADVSGTDDCAFGFRKVEALQAAIDNYDEMAALNVISGDIKIETILNAGATSTTDTTDNWADGGTHSLKDSVSKAGAVTYQIDGQAPTTTASFSFDAGEVVSPFFYLVHTSDLCETVELQQLIIESDKGSLE